MPASVISLRAELEPAIASWSALGDVLSRADDSCVEAVHLFLEAADINVSEFGAFRAGNGTLTMEPSQRYLDLVSTISAGDFDGSFARVEWRHGWPVLSVVDRASTVNRKGRDANPSPEGPQ